MGLNILAVDDDAGSGAALAVALKLFGHRPFIAGDAEDALKLVENDPAPFDQAMLRPWVVYGGLNGEDGAR